MKIIYGINMNSYKRVRIVFLLFSVVAAPWVEAQTDSNVTSGEKAITVKSGVADSDIGKRIKMILSASNWFDNVEVTSVSGVVTLTGTTAKEDYKNWAESIGYRTENVVAVINKINVVNNNQWDVKPLVNQTHLLFDRVLRYMPVLIASALTLLFSIILSKKIASTGRRLLKTRIENTMLRRLVAKLMAIPVLVLGVYLVFNVSGLGSLASTLIGGTGLVGLVIGIAFRNITENFLASILLSIQRPFVLGDVVQVLNFTGMVEAMTTRGTVIITLDGNHVQIPNTIIYKEPITNFTANPNIRQSFQVGIGYDSSISRVQALVLELLEQHSAVLKTPEPLILAEQLAASTVNLGIYFWVDSRKHSAIKVRSSVIRAVKHTLINEGISMPDDAREIIFPEGIRVHTPSDEMKSTEHLHNNSKATFDENCEEQCASTAAEGGLSADSNTLKQQGKNGMLGDNKTNLLEEH